MADLRRLSVSSPHGALGRLDLLLAVLLAGATLFHLVRFPLHVPAWSDEARQLYEAKRVLDGERMYRDVFDFILPGWIYLLALVYRLFGATLLAARTTIGAIHGVTAALVFVACRQLGVRRALACAAGLSYVVICQPAFPAASQHWVATSLSVLLLVICLGRNRSAPRAFAAGIVVGLVVAVLQQRGMLFGLGCTTFLVADTALHAPDFATFFSVVRRRILAFAAGAAIVVVPLAAWLLASAGFDPVWTAVVRYPLINYRSTFRLPWASASDFLHTLAGLIGALPFAIALPAARLLAQPLLRASREHVGHLALLALFAACALLSIAYLPDVIHISFVVPFFLVIVAESVEWALVLLPSRAGAALGWAVSLSILAACSLRLERNVEVARARRTIRWQSAFGPVDVSRPEVSFYEKLDALLRDVPSRSLYVHPDARYVYLLSGARNPTRFQFVFFGFHAEREVQEVCDDLAANPPSYVVTWPNHVRANDPVARFIEEHYDPMGRKPSSGPLIWKLRGGSPIAR